MTATTQMTTNTLNARKGWPQQSAVDFVAPLDASVTEDLPCGSVVHLSASLTYLPGVGVLSVMPMFTFQDSSDPDVVNDGGDPATTVGVWVPIQPSGGIMALVAVGAYELVSTNYNDAITYNPNDMLTSPTVLTGGVEPGTLTKGTFQTQTIVGVVSVGVTDNGYGTQALAFWPWFMPAFAI